MQKVKVDPDAGSPPKERSTKREDEAEPENINQAKGSQK